MPDERVGRFLARSHRRVLDHCDALLARPLPDDQRSRLTALRAVTEADLLTLERVTLATTRREPHGPPLAA